MAARRSVELVNNGVRRVLMVSPHFPPDSSAASHRVRLLAPHLEAAGWLPTVVTLEPSAFEGRLDPGLEALVPRSVRVVRAPAWRAATTRRVGLGDLGLRAYSGLRHTCRALLSRERFDALFITVYPVYPALLGAELKRTFQVPFVLDYQDPWVGAWGQSVGTGPGGTPDWKSRASRLLGTWLEPRAVNAADGLVAVSQGTIDGIVQRIPAAAGLPQVVIPLGFEPDDFTVLSGTSDASRHFDAADGLVHVCYVGTLLPTGIGTLRLLLRALARARAADPLASRLRLHFFGTSNQSDSRVSRVLPIAAECGVADAVTEMPGRLDYLDALSVLKGASSILLLGSSERHYTASKLFPALLAKRPILAIFHEASSVVSMLRAAGSEPTVRVLAYGDGEAGDELLLEQAACHLRALAAASPYNAGDVSLDRIGDVSARRLAEQLASMFTRVAA
jgi:glycosyltransferase involved in cell wall biosynthesis